MAEYYFWLVFSFIVGGLSGFQGIHERFGTDSGKAAKTIWCWLYLISRGGVAAGVFSAGAHLPYLYKPLLLRALICGVSAEGLLRAQFFVRRVKIDDKTSQDVSWSPVLSMLRWYQDLFLSTIARKFAKEARKLVEEIAERFSSFPEMYSSFELKIQGWGKDPRVAGLAKAAIGLKKRSDEALTTNAQADKKLRHELVYLVHTQLGITDLQNFFR